MAVSPVSSTSTQPVTDVLGPTIPSLNQTLAKRRSDFQTLLQDVQSGDLPGAQAALAAIQQDTTNAQSEWKAQFQGHLRHLRSSWQSKDLSAVQSDLIAVKNDLKTPMLRHLGHHGGTSGLLQALTPATTQPAQGTPSTTTTTGGLIPPPGPVKLDPAMQSIINGLTTIDTPGTGAIVNVNS